MSKIDIYHRGIYTLTIEATPDTDTTVLQLLQEYEISGVTAPCNGNGTCGKCKIIVIDGELSAVSAQEKKLLTHTEIDGGVRLACMSRITRDAKLELTIRDFHLGSIASAGRQRQLIANPTQRFSRSGSLQLGDMSLKDQRAVLSRLHEHTMLPETGRQSISLIRQLHTHISKKTVCFKDGVPAAICEEDESLFGAAVDLGTTTVVVHLLDLLENTVIDSLSAENNQKAFGANVISRVQYAGESRQHRQRLAAAAYRQLEQMIVNLLSTHQIDVHRCIHISIAGNTSLLHLLVGADAAGIASAPFIPVFTRTLHLSAAELGMRELPYAEVELFPSISGYVGSDISSGIHSSGMLEFSKPQLFIDVGTNGEIALAIESRTICCSTAAGPAFEGAGISCGSAGIPGAVDTLHISGDRIDYTTIAGEKPASICGSGVIDALAAMLNQDMVDEFGKMNEDHPMISSKEGQLCFLIASSPLADQDLFLSQKDIREIQLAKAAIAGGIRTLMKECDITYDDIEHVFLAGGFGSFINPISAGRIGLIPKELTQKTVAIGNSSSEGVILGTFWAEHRQDIDRIARDSQYIELSSSPHFQDFFIEEMLFPEDYENSKIY